MKHTRIILFASVLLVAGCAAPAQPENAAPRWSAVELLRNRQPDTLTDWQALQLAIMFTESRFNPQALGAAQDRGLMQITPVYVAEVNRIAGTSYAPEDAFDPAATLAMFDAMQAHYNPQRDTDTAIRYHNSRPGYRSVVLDNLALVQRYEAARRLLVESKRREALLSP